MKLNKNEVHVWTIDTNAHLHQRDKLFALLNETEKTRANRFRFEKDRHVFIVSHGALRSILAKYTNCLPQLLAFDFQTHKKPFLPQYPELKFNLSHSGDLALIAVTPRDEIGADIEKIKQKEDLDNIVSRFFSQHEVTEYFSLPQEQRQQAFYNGWTRKEAFIKATGNGLFQELKSFSVHLAPGNPAKIISIDHDDASAWQLHSIKAPKDYAVAVCWKGNRKTLSNYKF